MRPDSFIPLEFKKRTRDEMVTRSEEFLQLIQQRRSVRDYSDREIPRQVIDNAIRAAGSAPSGANMQPWHFVVVTDPAVRARIRNAAEQEEHEFYSHRASAEWLEALAPLGTDERKPFLETASCLIVIFLKKFSFNASGKQFKNYYTMESVGIASGFLIAALHDAGVATLTHTPSPMRFLNEILDRPNSERAFMVLVAGLPSEDATVPDIARLPLEEIASFIDG